MTEKTCRTCKHTLLVSNFSKDRNHKDGLASRCKACWSNIRYPQAQAKRAELEKMKFEGYLFMTEKTCRTCKHTLSLSNFTKKRSYKDGLDSRCRGCWSNIRNSQDQAKRAELENMKFKGYRVCPKCNRTLLVSDFYKNIQTKDKLDSSCKPCQKEYVRDWQKKNKDRFNSYQREWRHRNKEKYGLTSKYSKVLKKYGLSREEYDKLLAQTHCTICNADLTERKPALDHCHRTGRLRGILCGQCNRGLGLFYDNPETLKKAAEYLG